MRFLNPKTDYAFKKIFGAETSRDILISLLNAILELTGDDRIAEVSVLDPRLAPKIDGMKDTYLDVRVRDQRDRSYIVEMQVLNVEGFEKRVLYNACKAYVNQLGKGDPYHILTEVVAVTITDFPMFPDLGRVVSRFRLRADENPAICHQDLELVFAELPKFTKAEADLATTLDRWLYFLKTARDLTAIPQSLAVEPAIVKALELANQGAWSEEELEFLETREMWIADQRYQQRKLQKALEAEQKVLEAEQKVLEAEQKAQESEQKALGAERKARESGQKALEAEQKALEAERKAQEAGQKAREMERKALDAEKKALETERTALDAEMAGRTEGKAEGKAEMLIRQLRRRFPSLAGDIEDRVRAADSPQLDEWSERFVDGKPLTEIFGSDQVR